MCSANGYMNGGHYYNFDIVRHSSALAAGDAEAGTRLFGGYRGFGQGREYLGSGYRG